MRLRFGSLGVSCREGRTSALCRPGTVRHKANEGGPYNVVVQDLDRDTLKAVNGAFYSDASRGKQDVMCPPSEAATTAIRSALGPLQIWKFRSIRQQAASLRQSTCWRRFSKADEAT